MLVLRSLVFNVVFYAVLIVLMTALCPALVMGPSWVRDAARTWARASIWLLRVICGTRVEVRGRGNIPPGGLIVAAKHQSMWEVFALTLEFPDFAFVLKRELTWIPLFGWYLARGGQIAVHRGKGRAAIAQLTRKGRALIDQGGQLFIFPEGTRRAPGAPAAYKSGVARVYAELGVPCLPIALNSGLFWSRRSFMRRPGTIVVDILPPIAPGLPAVTMLARLEETIEAASDRLIDEAVARDPALRAIVAPRKATG